jgi:hypothetical protein
MIRLAQNTIPEYTAGNIKYVVATILSCLFVGSSLWMK